MHQSCTFLLQLVSLVRALACFYFHNRVETLSIPLLRRIIREKKEEKRRISLSLSSLSIHEPWSIGRALQNGLNETRRDRILRTYVRNTYRYHLHEIYSTLRNEYTDWERGEQSPSAICDGLLSLLGDGQVAAPLLRLALLHSASGGRGYFLHFQLGERPSQRGEEVPYLLGIPLLRGEIVSIFIGQANYTSADENLSKLLVHYLANFVRRG